MVWYTYDTRTTLAGTHPQLLPQKLRYKIACEKRLRDAFGDAMFPGEIGRSISVFTYNRTPAPENPRSEPPTRKEGHPRNYPSGIREDRPEDDVEYDT